jgi:STAS domain
MTVVAHPVPPGAVVLMVRGEVDLYTSLPRRGQFLIHLRGPAPHLIVDRTEVGFFGTAGLTVLATARQAARSRDRAVPGRAHPPGPRAAGDHRDAHHVRYPPRPGPRPTQHGGGMTP